MMGPQEESFEAGHPVAARPRDRNERGTAPAGTAVVVDEKPQLERGVEVVARVELLDRNRVRDARRRARSQRIDRDVVHPDGRLEAEIDDRPVEEVFGTGGTTARVVVEIRKERGHGNGQRVAAGEEGPELLGHGQRLVAVVVATERRVAVRLIRADQREDHLTRDLVGLARRVHG